MTLQPSGSLAARVRPGLWAGATVGLLTGVCYVFFFGGLDFSRGHPLAALLHLSKGTLCVCAALVALGAIAGAIVSLRTPDESS